MATSRATVRIDGTSLDYWEGGRGEPVVLVHGSASDLRTWEHQRDVLAERYRVIAYSRRYHWPNPRIPQGVDYAMAEHVDDLQALLDRLDARGAHLVGQSYGAFVGLRLAIRAPECLRSLVLAEPPVVPLLVSDPPRPSEMLKLLVGSPRTALALVQVGVLGLERAKAAARRGDLEEAMHITGRAVLGGEAFREASELRRTQLRDNAIEAELLGSGFGSLSADEVRRVEVPTLLVTGARSPALFHRLADRLAELLPRVERAEVPAASHAMHETNPADFNAAVLAFLARQQTAA